MILTASNKPRQLFCICYIDVVTPDQLQRGRADLLAMLTEMSPGFRLLVNLSQLKSMDIECLTILGEMMEEFDRAGVGQVVRVIPDESKDIGMNILTIFHYQHRPNVVTCQTMTEAARVLEL